MDKKNRKIQLTYNTQFAPLSYDFVYSLAICRALAEKMDINRKIDVLLINSVFRKLVLNLITVRNIEEINLMM